MRTRRVAITGVGLVTPIGRDLDALSHALQHGRHGIRVEEAWAQMDGVEACLVGRACPFELTATRKQRRNMGRVAEMAVAATEQAIAQAGLCAELLGSGDAALYYGSTDGSTGAAESYYRKLYTTGSFSGLLSSSYLKFMSHTCAANIAAVFGITGRVVPVCSACTSASQAIGEAYVSVATGREDVAIAGGAEEAHVTVAGVFDLMLATSIRYNDRPEQTPRPFDAERDGMVVGEGAGTVVLEDYERAQARGAEILGEIVGYGSNCDGAHLTSPSPAGMADAMRRALRSAELAADDIGYINAHGTGTEVGDIAETQATMEVFGDGTPISSTKGFTGHTLGACGAIETAMCLAMFRDAFLAPSRNLANVDPRCAPLHYVIGEPASARPHYMMTNNFAFGGINTSLVLAGPEGARG